MALAITVGGIALSTKLMAERKYQLMVSPTAVGNGGAGVALGGSF